MIRMTAAALLPLLLCGTSSAQLVERTGSMVRQVGNSALGGSGMIWARSAQGYGCEVDAKLRRHDGGDMVRVRAFYRASFAESLTQHRLEIYFDGNKVSEYQGGGGTRIQNLPFWLGGSGGSTSKTFKNVGGADVLVKLNFNASVQYNSRAELSVSRRFEKAEGWLNVGMNGFFQSYLVTNLAGGWANAMVVLSLKQSAGADVEAAWSKRSGTTTNKGLIRMDETMYQAYLDVTSGWYPNFFGFTQNMTDDKRYFLDEEQRLK